MIDLTTRTKICPVLDHRASVVFNMMTLHADELDFVIASDYRISRWARIPEAAVPEVVDELERRGWLQVVDRGSRGRRSIYQMDVPF